MHLREALFVAPLRKKSLFESNRLLYLRADVIHPNPSQPRRYFATDGLTELADSIKEHGILQPLSVRRGTNGYELVSGERRLRAARLAGLNEVPCIIVDVDNEGSSLLALIENIQRKDLDFVEEATALAKLISTYHLSQEEAAKKIGKSQSAVANKLRLLRLSPQVLDLLRHNGLTERHARALLRLEDDALQLRAANHIVRHHLTVARTEDYVAALASPLADKPVSLNKPTYILKDVRFFLNTITHGLSLMQSAGVNAEYGRQETGDAILLTIRIPK
jgi:ParB family chromosome partitioning protein